MEQRRREGLRLLAQGLSQAEVARRCGVSRVSVWRCAQQRQSGGPGAWKRRPLGRPPKLKVPDLRRLEKAQLQGAQAHGFLNDLWTLSRVAEVIRPQSGVRLHPGHVWRVLGRLGWSLQRPAARATQRDEAAIARRKKHTWPALKKALKEGRTLVFVDESGLSERPSVVRTWAPRGQTPQLAFSHAWGKLSVMVGITWWESYFRLYRGSIKAAQA